MRLPALPERGDQFPERWADELRPRLIEVDDLDWLVAWRAELDTKKAYDELHKVDATEALAARLLVDLRMAELLGPGVDGQHLPPEHPGGALDRHERDELRLYLERPDIVLAVYERRDRAEMLRHVVLRLIRQHRREDTVAEPSLVTGGDGWELRPGDFGDVLADLPDCSVDLILTDPPYPADDLPLWTSLAKFAARALGERGLLVAYTGQIFLPEVLARLGEHLTYGWTYCLDLRAGSRSRIMGRHVIQTWKPIVAFSTGTWPSGRWHDDLVISPGRDKFEYAWQQHAAPAERLIEHLCPRNGLVVDPFAGTGTFGLAARSTGRRFVGAELDARRHRLATRRLRGEA